MPPRPVTSMVRAIGRREEDRVLRERISRLQQLQLIAQVITSELDLDLLFQVIMSETNQLMASERSTVFLHDPKSDELWSLVATSMKRNEIRIPSSFGVAGWVFHHKIPLLINDPYRDPRFFQEIDRQTGFRTRNVICVPLTNRDRQCIGALQTLNKHSGPFNDEDIQFLTSISPYVTIALENARVYEQLKLLDKAKERIIGHLSHELKTPLAIIAAAFERIKNKLGKEASLFGLTRPVDTGRRNVQRLLDLQNKIDDILNGKPQHDKIMILNIIEDAVAFVSELQQEPADNRYEEILGLLKERIESLYQVHEIHVERIFLFDFLNDLVDEAGRLAAHRQLSIVRDFDEHAVIHADRKVLAKTCGGLLKNAIENTPDEGLIELKSRSTQAWVGIDFHDYGVGIADQNKELITGGFFHTQDTLNYSTKRPYDFNAGGSGSDLLRIKVFSERCGFSVDFNSIRCVHIPTDQDTCPGRISLCSKAGAGQGCRTAGGSLFTLRFPHAGAQTLCLHG